MEDYDSNLPDIVLDNRRKIMKKMLKVFVTIKEIKSIEECLAQKVFKNLLYMTAKKTISFIQDSSLRN